MAIIGILGSYGGLNMGDEAILTAMLGSFRRARPGDELVVFSRDPEHTRKHHDADRAVGSRDVSRERVDPEIDRLDLLLLGGGGLLYDSEARIYLRDVRRAQSQGIPTFAYAVGAGPLSEPEDREAVVEVVGAMDGVTVRDEQSKVVLEDAGVDRDIVVTADPALGLEAEHFDRERFAQAGLGDAGTLVAMSVREPGRAASHLDEDSYHALLAQLADYIVHRFGADVVFLPMERADIRHSHGVVSHMSAADRAHVLKGVYPPQQLLGLLKHFEFAVAMRLHVLILAALSGTPFLPLPYASKVTAFIEALGVEAPVGLNRETAGPLLAALDRLWDHRDDERARIAERLPALQERADLTCAMALRLLDPDPG